MKAIGIMVECLENDSEVAIIEGFIPSMVGVIDKCLKKDDEENVIAVMEVFNDLVESKIRVLHKHAQQLTKLISKLQQLKTNYQSLFAWMEIQTKHCHKTWIYTTISNIVY